MITDAIRRRKAEALEHALGLLRPLTSDRPELLAEAVTTITAHRDLLRFALAHPEERPGQLALL